MGSNKHSYLGILITIPEKFKNESVYDYHRCTSCNGRSNGKFCPLCGSATEIIYKEKSESISVFDALFQNGFDDECLNKYDSCEYYMIDDSDLSNDAEFIFPNNFNIPQYIDTFVNQYEKQLELLRNIFGEIKIKFGLTEYWA